MCGDRDEVAMGRSGFLSSLLKGSNTIDESRTNVLEMLHKCQEMYIVVLRALHEAEDEHIRARIKAMDREVNQIENRVRRDIYRYLALTKERDLLSSLQLHDIVNEFERVGDYSKNIAELAEMVPAAVDWGEYEEGMALARQQVLQMFDLTFKTVENNDPRTGRQCDDLYRGVAQFCDDTIEKLFGQGDSSSELVERRVLSLLLMLRYTKRVAAHLRNAVQTIVNPYHSIGYQP